MNEKFYEALEVCLQAIETGADIESVLKRYPQMAEELRPILETSIRAQFLAPSSIPDDVIRRGRARVLQHAAGMRKPAKNHHKSIFSFPRLATSLALALIFVLSGTGLVRASDGALPGDNLYPIKRTWEGLRLLLVFDIEGREELETEFEEERLYEIDELFTEGRHEMISFAGMVTQQNGDQWVVSGIPVQITPDSKLPAEPVNVGASILVEGRTNAQGFVEADRIEILKPGISLSPLGPTELEDSEDSARDDNPVLESNDNGDQDELKTEDSEDNQNGSTEDDDNVNENSNDSSSTGEDSGSSSNKGSSDKNDNGDDGGDHSGSGGGDGGDGEDDD